MAAPVDVRTLFTHAQAAAIHNDVFKSIQTSRDAHNPASDRTAGVTYTDGLGGLVVVTYETLVAMTPQERTQTAAELAKVLAHPLSAFQRNFVLGYVATGSFTATQYKEIIAGTVGGCLNLKQDPATGLLSHCLGMTPPDSAVCAACQNGPLIKMDVHKYPLRLIVKRPAFPPHVTISAGYGLERGEDLMMTVVAKHGAIGGGSASALVSSFTAAESARDEHRKSEKRFHPTANAFPWAQLPQPPIVAPATAIGPALVASFNKQRAEDNLVQTAFDSWFVANPAMSGPAPAGTVFDPGFSARLVNNLFGNAGTPITGIPISIAMFLPGYSSAFAFPGSVIKGDVPSRTFPSVGLRARQYHDDSAMLLSTNSARDVVSLLSEQAETVPGTVASYFAHAYRDIDPKMASSRPCTRTCTTGSRRTSSGTTTCSWTRPSSACSRCCLRSRCTTSRCAACRTARFPRRTSTRRRAPR